MAETRIAVVVGSLRADSHNRAVARAASELAGPEVTLEILPIDDVPLYDADTEQAGNPAPVAALKQAVTDADGLLFVTPEYNRSIPAVTKNVLDWLSRPFLEGPMMELPVGIVAASPGGHGGSGVRDHLAVSAAATGAKVYDPALGVGRIRDAVADGEVVDDSVRDEVRAWLEGFVAFVRSTAEMAESA